MGRRSNRTGRCARRNKSVAVQAAEEPKELARAPHAFVIHRGEVGHYVKELVRDFRKVMEPFTASSLKTMKKNSVKDFVSVSGMLRVTHFCVFTRSDLGAYLRIARVPRGPTLTFRVHNYILARDILSTSKKQYVSLKQFEHPPLIILNGFSGGEKHIKLMASTFQNMFPTINLLKVNLSNVRRCVLLNYDSATNLIDFRHFAIKVVPAGISKSVKKIVQSKVPNLSGYENIEEYLTNPAALSESEAEDDPSNKVVLSQKLSSRGNMASHISAIRTVEIGPRLTLELLKSESGLMGGEVLYHNFIERSEAEKQRAARIIADKRLLKEKRKREQEENVRKKEKLKEMRKVHLLKGKKKTGKTEDGEPRQRCAEGEEDESEDDDKEWYKAEVGENPDADLFTSNAGGSIKRKKPFAPIVASRKKRKGESNELTRDSKKEVKFAIKDGKRKINKGLAKTKKPMRAKQKNR